MKPLKTLAFSAAGLLMASAVARGEIFLNEVNVNPPGDDGTTSFEYIELIASSGGVESANGLTILLVDSVNGGYGKIRKVWPLNGLSTGSGGLLLLGRGYPAAFPFGAPPTGTAMGDPSTAPGTDNDWGGIDNEGLTLFLVRGFSGQFDQDLDPDDNGTLNVRPWTTLVDSVGFDDQTPVELRQTYAATDLTQAGYDPDNLSRKVVPQGQSYVTGDPTKWFGGDYPSGAAPTDLVLDTNASFGGLANPAATPGRVNESAQLADLLINEVAVNPPGNDENFEYIELIRASGDVTSTNGYTLLLVVTDDTDVRGRGVIAEAWSLDNLFVGDNGLLLLGDGYDNLNPWGDYVDDATRSEDPPAFGSNDISNDGLSLFLVTGFSGTVGADLDANNDGVLDSMPWGQLRDSIGFAKLNSDQTVVVASTYAPANVTQVGAQPNAGFVPDNVSRRAGELTPNNAGSWYGAEYGGSSQRSISFAEMNQFGFASFFGGFVGAATPGRPNLNARPAPGPLVINEVNIDPPGDDGGDGASGEFIELLNPIEVSQSCIGYHLLRVSGSPGNLGEVEEVWSVSTFSTGTNGVLVLGDSYDDFTPFPSEIRAETNREDVDGFNKGDLVNRDFVLLLVTGFNGAVGLDIDAGNDGIIDGGLGFTIVDGVNIGSGLRFGTAADLPTPFLAQSIARRPRVTAALSGQAWYGGQLVDTAGAASLGYSETNYFGLFRGGVTPGQFNHAAEPRSDALLINEANINPPGDDLNFEYIELLSTSLVNSGEGEQSTNGLTLLVIDTIGADTGTVMEAWNLDSFATGGNGILLLGDGYDLDPKGGPFSAVIDPLTAVADPERFGSKDVEDNDGLGLMLVRNFVGLQGQDLDADDNGTFDSTPWSAIVDSVAFGVRLYGMPSVQQATYSPGNISRGGATTTLAPNSAAAWYGGALSGSDGASTTYDATRAFDRTGLIAGGVGRATPGRLNLGGILDDLADNDADSAANIIERALNMDLDVSDVEKLPISAIVDLGGSLYQTLSYRQLKGGSGNPGIDYVKDGLRYTVEVSNDLLTWRSGAAEVELVSTVDDGNGVTETVMIRTEQTLAAGGRNVFMRLRITRNGS